MSPIEALIHISETRQGWEVQYIYEIYKKKNEEKEEEPF